MKNKPIQKDRNSAMFRKGRALTGLLDYLLGESIPQEVLEDKPIPEGMLGYWTGTLQDILPRLKSIEEHFNNLGYIAK